VTTTTTTTTTTTITAIEIVPPFVELGYKNNAVNGASRYYLFVSALKFWVYDAGNRISVEMLESNPYCVVPHVSRRLQKWKSGEIVPPTLLVAPPVTTTVAVI